MAGESRKHWARGRPWLSAFVGVFLASPLAFSQSTVAAPPLEEFRALRWEHRVLLLLGAGQDRVPLDDYADALAERDIIWLVLGENDIESNYAGPLGKALGAEARRLFRAGDRVLLIGKDGGIKWRGPSLDVAALFSRIDAMPMRRREMEERKAGSDPSAHDSP